MDSENITYLKKINEANSIDLIYDLYAISIHMGNMGGGHYIAYVKNLLNNNWYEYDDSDVQQINLEQVDTKNAYVLFYKKRNASFNLNDVIKKSQTTTNTTNGEATSNTSDKPNDDASPDIDINSTTNKTTTDEPNIDIETIKATTTKDTTQNTSTDVIDSNNAIDTTNAIDTNNATDDNANNDVTNGPDSNDGINGIEITNDGNNDNNNDSTIKQE
mmetsp:Transcript_50795/g.62233  ORF Transcript_50795/g.62233 Transcript_50795/m.62233 type:complete len:217 (+) Transcript_50795:721-1371(+)